MSFLNGLSAAGAGLAQFTQNYGAEAQKADAAAALQQSGAAISGNLLQQKAALELEQAKIADAMLAAREHTARTETAALQEAAPSDQIKLLRALGVLPTSGTTAPSSSAAPSPATATDTSTPTTTDGATATPAGPRASADSSPTTGPNSEMGQAILAKALGIGQPGSEEAIRMAIAKDVSGDPKFKYASAGQRAAEIEQRLAVASGKMTDPSSRELMAQGIASYKFAPLANYAMTKPGSPETMARVMELNPDYQEGRYPEINKAMELFGPGPQGDKVRFLNVGVQHLDVFDQAAQALKNGDMQKLNALGNYFKEQFGSPAPTTFDGLKQVVATEIEKSIAGGIGASADRDRLLAALKSSNSPAQLQEMTNGFRDLMGGQLKGLKRQYEDSTGFKTGPFAFENKLDPVTIEALKGKSPPSNQASSPASTSATGRTLPTAESPTTATHPPLPPGFRIIQ